MLTDEQLRQIDYALEMLLCAMRAANWEGDAAYSAGEKARAILAAHNAGAQEPVAWMYQSEDPFDGGEWFLSDTKPNRRNIRPLYSHPQPMPQTDAARDVLTEQRCLTNVELGELRLLIAFCESYLVAPYIDRGSDVDNAMRALRKRIAEIERLERAKGE